MGVILIGKNKSIKNQIQQIIGFSEGIDKHAQKHQDNSEAQVFSYSEKFRLLDTAKMLNNYIKENYKDVKQIKDVKSNIIQSFLNDKAKTCTQNTINTYSQSLYKIAALCNKNYSSCNLTWKQDVVIPKAITQKSQLRGVANQIPISDLNKICDYARTNYSISGQVILAQRELGIRVNELTNSIKLENIDFENSVLHLNCKGGKKLDREITPALREILEKNIKERNITSGRIFPVTENAVNTYLRRVEDKIGIRGRCYSTHNIRSTLSQLKYNELREKGLSSKEAAKEVSLWLNHGPNRIGLLERSYLELW